MLVVDEIGLVAVESLPDQIGKIAKGQDIMSSVELQSIRGGEPLLGLDFFQNVSQVLTVRICIFPR